MTRYRLGGLSLALDEDESQLKAKAAARLGVSPGHLTDFALVRRSLDARNKRRIHFVCAVEFLLDRAPARHAPGLAPIRESRLDPARPPELGAAAKGKDVLVIGAGPAGLFAAMALAEAGCRVRLIERGRPVESRMRDIGRLRSRGELDPESNICFGEGGAGTYTDGKLYTRIKHPWTRWVMKRFVEFGADPSILVDAHPHLGTDRLVRIVRNLRHHLRSLGVDYRFETKAARLLVKSGRAVGAVTDRGEELVADAVVLATGHSARDVYAHLAEIGVRLSAKPFAVGVRAEHPQALIDRIQFGKHAGHPRLGAAEYRLSHQVRDPHLGQRGVYSFCMCPGGLIVPSPTEPDGMAVNGMSNAKRASPWANSGLVVQVTPGDLSLHHRLSGPLAGVAFQQTLERATFAAGGGGFRAPAMRITDFVAGRASGTLAPCRFKPGVTPADLREVLPGWIAGPLAEAIVAFDRKMRGYLTEEANLLGSETRTSSPVRIERDASLQCVNLPGLYPVGEGAGYAGGIVSAAVDGLKAAASILAG